MPTALWMARELAGWESLRFVASISKEGLLSVGDKVSVGQLLVDIGAKIRVLSTPTRKVIRITQPGALLIVANGGTIRTFGGCTTALRFALKQYRWDFNIAEVSHPYWGAKLLKANSLLVNLKGKRLVDTETYFSFRICNAGALAPNLSTISQLRNDYDKLIASLQ